MALKHPEYAHGISNAELINEAIEFCNDELDGYEGMEYDDDCEVACQRSNTFIRELVRRLELSVSTNAPPAPQMAGYSAEPDFAASIKHTCSEEASNGAACGWMPCTGCYDTEDGHPTAHYRHSRIFGCDVGSGCSECGGLGVVFQYWSPEDLEDMQRDCVSEMKTATQDELSYQCDACSVPGYPHNTKCECTSIQQDESCPVGYPSLLCEVCDGKGIIPTPAPHVACVQALLNSLDRTSIAKIVDPSAWINEGGYDIEQVHSGPALIAADQIITYVLREARSLAAKEGSDND